MNNLDQVKRKQILGMVFLTLFLDLVSFSIIFPLFPAMARYYWQIDQGNLPFKFLFNLLNWFSDGHQDPTVLFGSLLSVIFSLLQFLFTPYWGRLSDRIGRRPVLLVTIFGMTLSHLIWIFSGSFMTLLIGRMVGGIMSGNISTATAVVADITPKKSRGKGMAIVGMAFALGFILGPTLGGLLSTIHIDNYFAGLQSYGINPFSAPALLAFTLSLINLIFVVTKFKETFRPDQAHNNQEKIGSQRKISPLTLMTPFPYPGVNLSNFGHFLFLMAFSGSEFALIFMVVDKFHFSPSQNGLMFLYVGIIIAFVQGGIVRRKAHEIGLKRMTFIGLALLMVGLVAIEESVNVMTLFLSLIFFATGASFAIPGFTSLVSCYSPKEKQGEVIGTFRSLGSLARVIGPPMMAFFYWHKGTISAFYFATLILIIPIIMVSKLPKVIEQDENE